MKKLVCALGAVAVACSAQAKLVNLADWMEARLGSRDAVYEQCVSAEGTSSGYTPNVLFDGVTYTRSSTAADEWNVLAESVPTSSVTFRIPDSVADEDIPALDRYLMHRTCVSTYTWQASPTRWTLFGRNSDGDEWTEIERVDNGFFYSRDGGAVSPPCECAHENALKARVRYRQYRLAFYSTRQNHGLRLVELQLVVDDGTAGNVIRVTPDGTGDGSDWENAANLQMALETAQRGDELWLKAGDYPLAEELSAPTACAILGGFAGNETSKEARTGTARSVIDATAVDNALVMTDVSFDDYILEDLAITNAVLRAIKMGANGANSGTVPKSGAGLRARNCLIAHNGTSTSVTVCEGHGAMIYTVKGAPVSFTGCTFDHNQMLPGNGNRTGNQNGMAICVRYGALALADCAFTDNGIPQFVQTKADGRDKSYGGAIYAEHASINATNCLFRGNRQVSNGNDGSIIYMNGNPEGTNTFVGCRFVGNSYAHYSVNISSTIRFSTSPDANGARPTPLLIDRCTFAYNLGTTCGGIRMDKGDLIVRNSIFYGNFMTTAKGVAADIELAGATATADIDYSLFSSRACIGGVAEPTLGANIVYEDPKFITPLETVAAQIKSAPVDYPTFTAPGYFNAAYDLSTIDVHVQDKLSPAIDAGDPAADYANEPDPNGGRMNIGCYANTDEAAISSTAVPVISAATLAFGADYTRPAASVTLADGEEDYSAKVYLCYGYEKGGEGTDWAHEDELDADAHPGDALDAVPARYYLESGRTLYWRVEVRTAKKTVAFDGPAEGVTVTGEQPPYWGKGLGDGYIHVRAGAVGAADGRNWLDAFPTFAEACAAVDGTHTNIAVAGTVPVRASLLPAVTEPVSIWGGFGGEETDFSERTAEMSTVDGEETYSCLNIANGSGCTRVDGICFTRSMLGAVTKSAPGDLVFSHCRFFACGSLNQGLSGRSLMADGSSAATLVITNCVFDRNWIRTGNTSANYTGTAGYLTNFKAVEIADTLYATNGYNHAGVNTYVAGRDGTTAGTLYIEKSPLTMTNCRFIGNRHTIHHSGLVQCTLLLTGNSPATFRNCLFAGNAGYTYSDSDSVRVQDGTVCVNLDDATREVVFDNCTMAYNLSGRSVCAGLNVIKGAVTIRNSVFFRNQYNTNWTDTVFGGDLRVAPADASANVAWTLLTSKTAPWVSDEGGNITWAEGVQEGDPRFVTTADEFEASFSYADYYQTQSHKGLRFKSAGAHTHFNLHVRGRGGYTDETTGEKVVFGRGTVESPAVDTGDPAADFSREPEQRNGRLNLGYYGNTPWATMRYDAPGILLMVR